MNLSTVLEINMEYFRNSHMPQAKNITKALKQTKNRRKPKGQ